MKDLEGLTAQIFTKMKKTFQVTTDLQIENIMDLVYREQQLRGQSADNYNTQEMAYRQAISDGAMRSDNYFAL